MTTDNFHGIDRLVDRLAALPSGIAKRSIGRLRLRGKESEIELYALVATVHESKPD